MITIQHSHATGTVVHGTARGDGTNVLLKGHALRWSRELGAWYVPHSRDRVADTTFLNRIAADLRTVGHSVSVEVDQQSRPIAERHADAAARADVRADRLTARAGRHQTQADQEFTAADAAFEGWPFGQPITDARSGARHARMVATHDRHRRKAIDAETAAADERHRAAAAAATARHLTDPSPQFAARKAEQLRAELRRVERLLAGATRTIAVLADGTKAVESTAAATGQHRDLLEQQRVQLLADLEHWSSYLEVKAAAGEVMTPAQGRDSVRRGDAVHYRGRWHEVVRVNRQSVSVPSGLGSWTDTIRFDQLTGHRPADDPS